MSGISSFVYLGHVRWVCGGVGVWGCVGVCGGVWRPATTPSHTVTKVGSMMLPTFQKHMEKHVAAPSLENSGLNLTNSQLSSPPQAAVRTSTRCQSSLTSVQSEVLQHMAPGRKKSLSKLPAIKKISSPQLGIKHIVLCV